ncbi:hypothetical protein [Microbacterium luticocti]|uniref:hypothetical protein n=1 Tax=Microbacterium luticocti TaxID=451764 RepID=UPI00042578EE|nr:hypothetical protein [Microbacterium luticocti]
MTASRRVCRLAKVRIAVARKTLLEETSLEAHTAFRTAGAPAVRLAQDGCGSATAPNPFDMPTGAPARGERIVTYNVEYNRLMQIEQDSPGIGYGLTEGTVR